MRVSFDSRTVSWPMACMLLVAGMALWSCSSETQPERKGASNVAASKNARPLGSQEAVSHQQFTGHTANGSDLLSIDFSKAVETMTPKLLGKDIDSEQYIGVTSSRAYNAERDSVGDEVILTPKVTPCGNWSTFQSTLSRASRFIIEQGTVPKDGSDLLGPGFEDASAASIGALSPAEQANHFHAAINHYTGRLHSSFSPLVWSPGGIFIDPLQKKEDGNWYTSKGELYQAHDIDADGKPFELQISGGFEYGVWGDEQNEVLFRDTMVYVRH